MHILNIIFTRNIILLKNSRFQYERLRLVHFETINDIHNPKRDAFPK